MTPEQAAERLGAAPHHVADITEHDDGHLVTLRTGQMWLVTDTVSRPYVADVDGERTGEVASVDGPENEERTTEPAPAPKPAPKGKARRSKASG